MGNPFEDDGAEDTPEADPITEPEYTPEQIKGASFVTNVWMTGLTIIGLFIIGCLVFKILNGLNLIPWR